MGGLFRRTPRMGHGFAQSGVSPAIKSERRLAFFERFLSVWVVLCMIAGVIVGRLLPSAVHNLRGLEFGKGSQINVPLPSSFGS